MRAYVSPISLVIPRASGVAITLRKGRFRCRNAKQARDIVSAALTIGLSIDSAKSFNGQWTTFCSPEGVQSLRIKHKWSPPKVSRPPRGKTKAIPLAPPGDNVFQLPNREGKP